MLMAREMKVKIKYSANCPSSTGKVPIGGEII
jgi:hypothetical protein